MGRRPEVRRALKDAGTCSEALQLALPWVAEDLDRWVAAAEEWNAVGRPFETAYACWRGAQAARAAGRGT